MTESPGESERTSGGPEQTLLVPLADVVGWLDRLWTTETADGRTYWHIKLRESPTGLELLTRAGSAPITIRGYQVKQTELSGGSDAT